MVASNVVMRFGLRIFMIVFTFVCVWIATCGISNTVIADDIRRTIVLLLAAGSICRAIWAGGKAKVFWSVFSVVFVSQANAFVFSQFGFFFPRYLWCDEVALWFTRNSSMHDSSLSLAITSSTRIIAMLVCAYITGLWCAAIYEYGGSKQSR